MVEKKIEQKVYELDALRCVLRRHLPKNCQDTSISGEPELFFKNKTTDNKIHFYFDEDSDYFTATHSQKEGNPKEMFFLPNATPFHKKLIQASELLQKVGCFKAKLFE